MTSQGVEQLTVPDGQLLSAHRFPNITRLEVVPSGGWNGDLTPAQVVLPLLHLSVQHLPQLRHLEIASCAFLLRHVGILSDQLTQLTCLKVRLAP